MKGRTPFDLTLPGDAIPHRNGKIRPANGTYCGHLLGGEDLVIRWYARALNAATLLKGAMALAALVALVVGAGANWRWD
jgi:hypothetical protein